MAERIVRREGLVLIVLEEGEYCCVCKDTDWDKLGLYGFGDPDNPLKYTVCRGCKDSDKFRDFLAREFEAALSSQPERWRKNADGTWSERETTNG